MTTTVLNTQFIKRRRAEVGLSTRQLAAACGLSSGGLRILENGVSHGEVTVGLLDRLAVALACQLGDLLVAEHAGDQQPSSPTDDVATLGQILHNTGVLTPTAALAELCGWDHRRLNTALDALSDQLPTVGLTLHRLGSQVSIRAAADVDGDRVAAAVRCHINRDGLNLGEARLLRRVLDGNTPTTPSNSEQVAFGVLANARLIEPEARGSWRPHHDVLFSVGIETDGVEPTRRRSKA